MGGIVVSGQPAEVRVASSAGPDVDSRVGPASVGGPGGKHCRAEQVIAEAAAAFWESQRPCQEGLGLGQMSSIHNQPGEDGTFRKAIKGPMRCRFWLPCCAHPFELGPRWSAGAQEHADRLVSFLPVPAQGQGDRAKGPSTPTSSSETRLPRPPRASRGPAVGFPGKPTPRSVALTSWGQHAPASDVSSWPDLWRAPEAWTRGWACFSFYVGGWVTEGPRPGCRCLRRTSRRPPEEHRSLAGSRVRGWVADVAGGP